MMEELQRTDEWFKARAGKFTGSRFVDVLAESEPKTALCLIAEDGSIEKKLGNGKIAEEQAAKQREKGRTVEVRQYAPGEKLKAWHDLIWQLVVERITGEPLERGGGAATAWGRDVEPAAREAYELETGNTVDEAGFIPHPAVANTGCSPDGLVGEDGGLEIKCPKDPRIHLERFFSGVPAEYIPQIQGCMWVTGRKWWDFVSFDPRMPAAMQMLVIRVWRDDEYIARLEAAVIEGEKEVERRTAELLEKVEDAQQRIAEIIAAVMPAPEAAA